MGDYADDQIRRDQRAAAKRIAAADGYELDDDDDDGQVGFYRDQAVARQEERRGFYRDQAVARQEERRGFYRDQAVARQEERRGQLAAANAEMVATTAALAELGLTLERQRSEYHVHILRIDGRRRTLVAQWWPSTGTAVDGAGKRQRCSTGKALVAWLRDKQRADARRDGRSP